MSVCLVPLEECHCEHDDVNLGACMEVGDWVDLHCRACCKRPDQWVAA